MDVSKVSIVIFNGVANSMAKVNMTKDEMVSKVKGEVEVQEKNLENLKQKAAEESDDLASEFQQAIDDLQPKIDQAKEKLAEIADATEDQWDDIKDSLEEGWDEAKSKFDEGWDGLTDSVKKFFT